VSKVRAKQVVKDIRSGRGDEDLRKKYNLSPKAFRRLLQMLVGAKAIEHRELYKESPSYKAMTDALAARRSPRAYVPIAIRIYNREKSQKGFVRDLSATGLRVAGIEAMIGQSMDLSIPLKEIDSSGPLQFTAVCRWARTAGNLKKYVMAGFDITDISDEVRSRLRDLVDLFRSHTGGYDKTLYTPLNLPELLKSAQAKKAETESREFAGSVEGVDILDFVQFMILSGHKSLLTLESSEGDACELHFDDGRIVHAHHQYLEGREAFFECMSFPGGKFSTQPWSEPERRTIDEPGDFMLFEAARRRDEVSGRTRSNEDDRETTFEDP
jgi:hypothetical protein